ncbi:hypothetical protein FOA43_002425 [Brettanomyces nanus]|uniref:FAD-binding PCMH-type domain-containing protein n=1 Tax=Eeniella nana TaxID=13502 RepID=A0A875S7D6_EENNA|nr:uncharacterized protein FOA43_002425 [Brettanomyces nanus]QPG75084.1 hypothetical protein FOA43_002425 [Brettanomyces nanus]
MRMFKYIGGKVPRFVKIFKRYKITGSKTATRRSVRSKDSSVSSGSVSSGSHSSGSGSPFANSLTFQAFMIVGAMGAGYSLGKSMITENPPTDLFPSGSTTKLIDLPVKNSKEYGDYDKFKRCILRILESQGYTFDQKNNKNDYLFEDSFISKDLAQVMNDVSHFQEIFWGKKIDDIDEKKFIFYPENASQVSSILKYCQEFRIPVFTTEQSYLHFSKKIPYRMEINFSRMTGYEAVKDDDSVMDVQPGVNLHDINEYLNEKGFQNLNSTTSPLDLLLSSVGIELTDSSNRLFYNKFDKSQVIQFTAVLSDGTEMTVDRNSEGYKLFELLSSIENSSAIITNLRMNVFMKSAQSKDLLVVLAFKSIDDINSTVKELSAQKRISQLGNIGFVDSSKCRTLEERFEGYKTFAVLKVAADQYSRLGSKFNKGCDRFKVFKIDIKDLDGYQSSYYSNRMDKPDLNRNDKPDADSKASSALIVSRDLLKQKLCSYYSTSHLLETAQTDKMIVEGNPQTDLLRRIKLSLDPAKILNVNVDIIAKAGETQTKLI